MEFIFGAPVIKNERESIILQKHTFLIFTECDSFYFEFRIATQAELFFTDIYGKQHKQSTLQKK